MIQKANIWLRRALFLTAVYVLALAWWRSALVAPAPTLLLLDRHGSFLGEVGSDPDGEMGYWALPALPARAVAATLAIEDRRYWSHPGVDPLAVLRAAWQRVSAGRRVSGASTLAMQIARMQNPGPRTYTRKAMEALTALFLTLRHGREALLAHYLRLVPYGNRIHGIAYAARRYLDKPAEDLSWAETAFLSALPQAPARMNPYTPAGRLRAIGRARQILEALRKREALSASEFALALEQLPDIAIPPRRQRPENAMHALLHLESMLQDPALRRGVELQPIVHTTLDLELQAEASWLTFEAVRSWRDRGAGNAALIVLDRAGPDVLAWVGSADYFDRRHAGAIDYTRVARSPGSTLKPFLYAHALERGLIGPATVLDDLHRAAGGITNADEAFLGPMLPKVALANSRNVPAVRLLAQVGIDEFHGFLRELRLHDGRLPARRYGLELAIGGLPTTLEALVRAYGALARDGRLRDLRWWAGQDVPPERRALSAETARQLTLFLSDAMARLPSFPRMGATEYPFPVAVKTGTSSAYRDAWTVAYSTRYVVGVWVGHPDSRPMNGLSGYRAAAQLAQKVLLHLHGDESDGLRNVSFPPPQGYRALRVCGRTGRIATPACDQVLLEWFRPAQEPTEPCAAHVRLAIDARNGAARLGIDAAWVRRGAHVHGAGAALRRLGRSRGPAAAAGAGRRGGRGRVAAADRRTDAATGPPRAFQARDPAAGPCTPAASSAETALPRLAAGPAAQHPCASVTVRRIPQVRVTSPDDGVRLLRDPEMPPQHSSLLLQAIVDPPAAQLVWYVDGEPFRLVDYPYTARWQLQPGEHTFEARVPFTQAASAPVRIRVQ